MSTMEQLKGDSTRRQLIASEDYAREHGLELADILHDRGVSAFTGRNAEMGKLAQFLELAKSGEIEPGSYLIVESLDRITRNNLLSAFALLGDIVDHGIIIVTLIDGQLYSKESVAKNPFAMMMAAMILMRAHEESYTKSVRLSAAWANKRSTARNGQVTKQRLPHWLRFSEDGLAIEVIEERAEIIREIYDLSSAGFGAFSIAKRLNKQGIATWGRGAHWQESYVKKILGNRSVLGEYQPRRLVKGDAENRRPSEGEPISGYYPPVIDEVMFTEVQNAIARRKVSGKGRKGAIFSNLFTGLLRCKSCKSSMRYIDKGPPPKGGRYLRCSKALMTQDCPSPLFRYDKIESHLFRILTTINLDAVLNNPEWLARTKELRQNLLNLEGREHDLQRQIDNVASAIAEIGNSSSLSLKIASLEIDLVHSQEEKRNVLDELAKLSVSSGLNYNTLVERLSSAEITDDDRLTLRRKFSSELGKLVTWIEIGRTYPTPGPDIPGHLLEGLTYADMGDANRFVAITVLYKTMSFTEFDAFTGERIHYEMDPRMSLFRERDKIQKLT